MLQQKTKNKQQATNYKHLTTIKNVFKRATIPILIFTFLTFKFITAQVVPFYYGLNNIRNYITPIQGKYTVEFNCDSCTQASLDTQLGDNFKKLSTKLYVIVDTSFLLDQHIIFPSYLSEGGNELFISSEILIKFKSNTTLSEKNNIISIYNLQFIDSTITCKRYKTTNSLAKSIDIYNTGKVIYCNPNIYSKAEYMSVPTDPYFNKQFYLQNSGQLINYGQTGTSGADIHVVDAWDITKGNSNIIVAVIDEGIGNHPDLPSSDQLILPGCNVSSIGNGSDPNNPAPASNQIGNYHGQACAGIIAANHNNIGIAGIAPDCTIMPVRIEAGILSDYMATTAIDFAVMNGANIISSSWGWYEPNVNFLPSIIVSIENAVNNNVSVFWAAGNSAIHYNSVDPNATDDGYIIFPASCKISNKVVVGGTDRDDKQSNFSPHSNNYSHNVNITASTHKSYFEYNQIDTWDVWSLDIPNYDGQNPFPYNNINKTGINFGEELPSSGTGYLGYTAHFGGTSAAAPQAAAVAALMLSVNPCLSNFQIKDILENTADKVGGYDYTWKQHGLSKETGNGRLNATNAVKTAQLSYTNLLDLYIKDCDQDFGFANMPNYNCWGVTDKSPDIWVRNSQAQPDFSGYNDLIHEDPEYNAINPVYIYVRVHNKSCVASTGNEQLGLYWSKAATWQSWPQNWNGTDPNIGNLVSASTVYIPILQPGEVTILEVPWNMPTPLAPGFGGQLPVCVLARIEGSLTDPIVLSPSGNNDIEWSNNVAITNMTTVDNINNFAFMHNGIFHPIGKEILIGNSNTSIANSFDFKFETEKGNLAKNARIHLITNNEGYNILRNNNNFEQDGVQGIVSNNEIILTKDSIYFKNLSFNANSRIPLYVGFSFYTSSTDSNASYTYKVAQSLPDSSKNLGAETFIVNKYNRKYFKADAGIDKSIKDGMSVQLQAVPVAESVVYKWFDENKNFVGQGLSISVEPSNTTKYKLEVISNLDGFIDIDYVNVAIIEGAIVSVSPNPCTNNLSINYTLSSTVTVANAVITNVIANTSNTISLNINNNSQSLDLSNYPTGLYTVSLLCNGLITDAVNIIKL